MSIKDSIKKKSELEIELAGEKDDSLFALVVGTITTCVGVGGLAHCTLNYLANAAESGEVLGWKIGLSVAATACTALISMGVGFIQDSYNSYGKIKTIDDRIAETTNYHANRETERNLPKIYQLKDYELN